jgi:pimeloyl-ACP methyl ester carboxylesterase
MTDLPPLDAALLPRGIRARYMEGINGLRMHLLEAGEAAPGRPLLLLLHGFPELAYSWRKVMPALAEAGFHVAAPDQRGYGRTTGQDTSYDTDLMPFSMLNLARDALGLVTALGYREAFVVGHDFGSSVAAWCALTRPDVFRRLAMMSAPFPGPPTIQDGRPAGAAPDVHAAMAALPRPRKHYQWYYCTRPANADMMGGKQGLPAFLRAYYHHKSADWPGNKPFRLAGWTADELAKMPTYYIMDAGETMAETVAHEMPSAEAVAACRWLPEGELSVYAGEYARTGFQGGLNWYRARIHGPKALLELFSGRRIEVPATFISGASDWGIQQVPGAMERMAESACADWRGTHLLPGAGHWVQQEQPAAVTERLLAFLRG